MQTKKTTTKTVKTAGTKKTEASQEFIAGGVSKSQKATSVMNPINYSGIPTEKLTAASILADGIKPKYQATAAENWAAIGSNILTGLADVGYDLMSAVDFLDDINNQYNPLKKWNNQLWEKAGFDIKGNQQFWDDFFDEQRDDQKSLHEWNDEITAKADNGWQVAAKGTRMVANAIPAALVAYATGGSSLLGSAAGGGAKALTGAGLKAAAKQGGTALVKYTAKGAAKTVATVAKNAASDPNFWMSFAQISGNSYSSALQQEGVTQTQAQAYALLNGMAGALVEVGGGLQKIPTTKAGVWRFVRSAAEEGGEEVVQGIIDGVLQKAIYDSQKEWASWSDPDAILSGSRALEEFIGGVVVGGVLGAPMTAAQMVNSYQIATRVGQEYIDGVDGKSLEQAFQMGMRNIPGSDARKVAEKAARMYARREGKVTPYAVGRMVLESQAPQAVRQQQIAGIAVRTAQDMGVNLKEFAEPIAVVAARANIPMEFVSEATLAPRQVGNIPPVNRTATSPQANVEHPTHLGDVGNLPSGVPGAAGLQSTAGETAAAGVTPSGAEASAPPSDFAASERRVEGGKETVPSGQYSVAQVVGDSGINYGIGVKLDSDLLTGLSDAERIQMVKLWVVEELAGKSFVAYDGNTPVEISIVNNNEKIINENGKKYRVLEELYRKNIYRKIKQEAVVLADELIEASKYDEPSKAKHKHDWLDNDGKNLWDSRTVHIQDKSNAVWEATLHIANSTDGRKILYDISPIKMVEEAGKSASTTTNNSITENGENVNTESPVPAAVMEGTDKNGNIFFGAMYDREGGKILLNADAIKDGRITVGQSLDFFLKHELTHKIERAGAWNTLAKLARREMGAEAFDAQVQAVQQHRAADGDTVGSTPEGAKKEVVADWVGTNLFKKEFAAVMAKEYKGFANNLVLTFSGLRRGLAATEKGRQAARMKYAEQLYLKALAESAPDVTDEQIAARLEEVLGQMAEDGQPTAEDADGVSGQFAVVSGEKVDSDNDSISVKQQIMQNMDFLRNQQSVDAIEISDITLKDAKQQAERIIKTIPEKIEVQGIGSIITDEKRLKNGLRYIESVQDCMAYNAIQRVLKRGNVIHERADHKERRYSTFTIAAPVDFVNGDVVSKYIVGVVVREQGKKYYKMHRAVLIPVDSTVQNEKGSNARRSAALSKDKGGTTIDITSNTTVPHKADGVNSQSVQNGGENSPTAGQRAQMTPEIAAQLQKNQAEIDERNRRRGIQKADAQAELDAVVDNDVDNDVDSDAEVDLDAENIVDLSSDNELAERIGAQRGAGKYKIIQEYILEQLGGQEIVFSDGRKAIVDRSDARHIGHDAADKKTAQISKIKELIETAQLYAEDSQVEHSKFDYFCYYQAMVQYDGEVFAVYLNVGRAKNDGKYHLYDITQNLRDTADRMNGLGRPKPNEGYALRNGVSTDSIFENGKNVNGKFDLSTPEELRAQAAALEKRAAQLERKKQQLDKQEQLQKEGRQKERERKGRQKRRQLEDRVLKELSRVEHTLRRPTKDNHIPPELVGLSTDFVLEIEDSLDGGNRIERRIAELEEKKREEKDLRIVKRLERQINNLKEAGDKLSQKMADIRRAYGDYVKAEDIPSIVGDVPIGFIERVQAMLVDSEGNTRRLDDLDINELSELARALQCITHTVAKSNTFLCDAYLGQEIHAFGLRLEKETKSNKLFGGKWWHNFKGNLSAAQLGVTRFFDMMGGYTKNSQWSTVGDSFLEAQKNYLTKHRDFIRHFSEITNHPEFKQLNSIGKKGKLYDVGLRDADGQSVLLTRDLMLSLYQHLTKPANRQAFIDGGVEVPDAELYAKGDIEKAIKNGTRLTRSAYYEKIHDVLHQIEQNTDNLAEHNRLTGELLRLEEQANAEVEEIVKSIEGQLTKFDRKYLAAVDSWFDGDAQQMLNDTTMTVYGFNKAVVEHYYPIYRDKNFVNRDFDNLVMDATLDNMGSMKTRVKSTAPLQLVGMTDVVTRSARETLQFAAYLPVMTDIRRLLNVRSQDGNVSLRDAIDKMADKSALGTTPMEYIENLMADLAGARKSNENGWFMTLRRNAIRATMTFNMRVAAKQTGALFSSASELGWPYMSKALLKKKVDPKTVAEYSVYFFERYYGDGGVEEYVEMRRGHHLTDRLYNKLDEVTRGKWLNWCADMDNFVCNVLWNSCVEKIADTRTDLTRGSEEFNRAVGELLDTVIAKTQSNYTLMERSDAQRDPSAHMKILTLYKTDALQGFGILYESIHRVRKYSADLKAGINGVTEADVKAAKEKLASSIPAVIVGSAIWPAIIGMLVNMLLNRTGNYRDEDNALTVGSVTRALTSETLGGLAGMVMLGDQLYDAVASVAFGEKYYGLSDTGVESFTGALESIGTIKSLIEGWATENTFDLNKLGYVVADMGSVMGLPLKNAWDMGKGVINHWKDIKSGKVLSFEAGAEISATQYFNQLYTAISRGKDEKAQELREYLIANGKSEADINTGLRAAVKRKDKDFDAQYKEAIAEAHRDMFYRQLTAEEQKKVQSGIKGYIADSILAEKTGSEMTKTNQKAAESIDKGRVSTAQYFSVKTARNAAFVDKDGDGEVSKTERRQVLNTMEVDAYLKKLFL